MSESLSMKWNRRLRGLTMFVFNFGVESRAKCWAESARNFRFPWQFSSLNTTFFPNRQPKGSAFYSIRLLELFFSCCIVVAVTKENPLNTPAIVSLANFQGTQMLRHPRLAFDWLSVSLFDYRPIRISGLLLLCTELTLFCIELLENCIYLNQ